MQFDVHAEMADIMARGKSELEPMEPAIPAISAIRGANSRNIGLRIAEIAGIAARQHSKPKTAEVVILTAI